MKKLMLSLTFGVLVLANMSVASGPGLNIGDIAPDFKLKNVDGKMVSLADFPKANGFIIIFTCNHCPFSVAYEDRIIDLHKKFGPQGYQIIAINPNDPAVQSEDSFDAMVTRAKEKSFTFPYLIDQGQKVYPQYGATRTPHVFVLDKERIVRYIGAIDDNFSDASAVQKPYLADAITALQNGKKPEVDYTRAVGCTIKVKK